LRAVDGKTCRDLRGAGLEEGRDNVVTPRADREDGADRDVVFQIGRSVERIDRDTERRLGMQDFRQRRFLGEDSRNRRRAQRINPSATTSISFC
jgi:hypothetical protein